MSKSTKTTKPAAPQAKTTATKKAVGTKKAATKKAAAPVAAPVVKAAPAKTTTKKVAEKATVPAKKAAPKKKAAVVKPVETVTVITAKIDVGFGNTLHLRGTGPGLSWDEGLPLNCVGDSEWTLSLTGATAPVSFKFLVNDETWSAGEDFVVEAGSTIVLEPEF